jgi:hypothetical protein
VNDLRRAVAALAAARHATERRMMALVGNMVLSQMLPDSAIKGGTGLKLRLGESLTRETPDLDTAFRGDLESFRSELADKLSAGWGGFTGTAAMGQRRAPESVPTAYAMQPFRVTLRYNGKVFKAIDLEVGYDELQATSEPVELVMSAEVVEVFEALGLLAPAPVRVQPLHHQIAQKIHAVTEPGSDRAHDLVDLQLVVPSADDALVANTVRRLFHYRGTHDWQPEVVVGSDWPTLYALAAEGLNVLPTVDGAVNWINAYLGRLSTL